MNKKSSYAFEAVLYIACTPGVQAVSLKDICTHIGVTERYLEQTMQRLVHSGIIRGVRGPKGGYLLAREKRKITLREIFEVVDINSNGINHSTGSSLNEKIIQPLSNDIKQNILEFLGDITISDLYERAKGAGITDKIKNKTSDFNI